MLFRKIIRYDQKYNINIFNRHIDNVKTHIEYTGKNISISIIYNNFYIIAYTLNNTFHGNYLSFDEDGIISSYQNKGNLDGLSKHHKYYFLNDIIKG